MISEFIEIASSKFCGRKNFEMLFGKLDLKSSRAAQHLAAVDHGDVGFFFGDRRRHPGQYAFAVADGDQQGHIERSHGLIGPFHGHEAFAVLMLQALAYRTVLGMDDQTLTAAQVAHDGVTRFDAGAKSRAVLQHPGHHHRGGRGHRRHEGHGHRYHEGRGHGRREVRRRCLRRG